MRRRLDLAAALVANPPVLFLDEPTTGLDPRSRIDLWETIEELVADGTTVLLTTQYLEEADRLADRITVIDHGRVIAEGTARRAQGARRRLARRGHADPPGGGVRGDGRARGHDRRAAARRRDARAGDGRRARRRGHGGRAAAEPRRRRRRGPRGPPPDARRRVPVAHRPRGRAPRSTVERAWRWRHDPRHARAGGAQPRAAPAQPGHAARLHGAADHVRAAVRVRLRRRDRDAGLRGLHRLPDPGDDRPADRVRRVRDRARARRGHEARA